MPSRLLAPWSQGRLAIGTGGLLKPRLLAGALRLAPEEMRHHGAGQLVGRALEAVAALALSGGLLGLVAGMELLIAAAVLHAGAGAAGTPSLLLGWVAALTRGGFVKIR